MLNILASSFMIATRADAWEHSVARRVGGKPNGWIGLAWLRRRRDRYDLRLIGSR